MTFDESTQRSATEFHLLRERAENKTLFDQAVEWMQRNKFRADLKRGCVRSVDGVQSQFVGYDWAHQYAEHPHFVFYDFFRGFLLNKYSRMVRGLDQS